MPSMHAKGCLSVKSMCHLVGTFVVECCMDFWWARPLCLWTTVLCAAARLLFVCGESITENRIRDNTRNVHTEAFENRLLWC